MPSYARMRVGLHLEQTVAAVRLTFGDGCAVSCHDLPRADGFRRILPTSQALRDPAQLVPFEARKVDRSPVPSPRPSHRGPPRTGRQHVPAESFRSSERAAPLRSSRAPRASPSSRMPSPWRIAPECIRGFTSRSNHVLDHLVQVDVRQNRRHHATLGRAGARHDPPTLLHRPSLQPLVNRTPNHTVAHPPVEKAPQSADGPDHQRSSGRPRPAPSRLPAFRRASSAWCGPPRTKAVRAVHGLNSCSYTASSTIATARCSTLSSSVGMPIGRVLRPVTLRYVDPPHRRRLVPSRLESPEKSSRLPRTPLSAAVTPSMPAAPSFRVRWYASYIHAQSMCMGQCRDRNLRSPPRQIRYLTFRRSPTLDCLSAVCPPVSSMPRLPLPSSGSLQARFPAFIGYYGSLRLPAARPHRLVASPAGTILLPQVSLSPRRLRMDRRQGLLHGSPVRHPLRAATLSALATPPARSSGHSYGCKDRLPPAGLLRPPLHDPTRSP